MCISIRNYSPQLPNKSWFYCAAALESLRGRGHGHWSGDIAKIQRTERYALVVVFIYMKLTAAMDDFGTYMDCLDKTDGK